MLETEKLYLSAILQSCNFVQIELDELLTRYKSFKTLWELGPDNWSIKNSKSKLAISLRYKNFSFDSLKKNLKKSNTKLVTIYDDHYPHLLKQINDPPTLLYYQGNVELLNKVSIGVVGTREPSQYGERVVERLIPDLVSSGLVIVSGFQRGIDTFAHQAAINNSGKTIAVLGTGIDIQYPSQNRQLFKTVSSEHLVLTEYPFGMMPMQFNFPRRNRIITGLSLGTLIIEAAIQSGSLVSAKYALEQSREVFAVPGSIFTRTSSGTNYLIKQGASPVTSSEDILSVLKIDTVHKCSPNVAQSYTESQLKILEALSNERNLDELAELLTIPAADILADITVLTLSGKIMVTADNTYVREN
jgi:DNA processing protein